MIEQLERAVKAEFPEVTVKLERPPGNPEGVYWLHLTMRSKHITVEWSPHRGFGVHVAEDGGPDDIFEDYDAAWDYLRGLLGAARDEPEGLLAYTRMLTFLRNVETTAELNTALTLYVFDLAYSRADICRAERRVRIEKGWR